MKSGERIDGPDWRSRSISEKLKCGIGWLSGQSYHLPGTPTGLNLEMTMSRIVDAEKKRALCARLARIEGQIRGLQKLIDGDADCEKIAQQMAAARKALDKSFFSMVGCMIEQGDQSAEHVAEMLTKFA
ncbi:MAG: metal-sensing transcriptional repressor [Burkholderiaceae bacterium]